jgi:hypothetical protein
MKYELRLYLGLDWIGLGFGVCLNMFFIRYRWSDSWAGVSLARPIECIIGVLESVRVSGAVPLVDKSWVADEGKDRNGSCSFIVHIALKYCSGIGGCSY